MTEEFTRSFDGDLSNGDLMPTPEPQTFFNWALGALGSLLLFLVNMYRTKIEMLEKMSSSYVSRVELQKHIDDMRIEMERNIERLHDDRLRMHTENLNRFDRIDDAVVRLHERMNDGPRQR